MNQFNVRIAGQAMFANSPLTPMRASTAIPNFGGSIPRRERLFTSRACASAATLLRRSVPDARSLCATGIGAGIAQTRTSPTILAPISVTFIPIKALNMLGEYGEYCGRSLLQCVERWGMIECIVELKPPSNRPWGYVRARPNWVLELLRNRGIDPEEQSFGGFVSGGFALGSSGGFALGCVLCEKCVAADWEVWGEVIKEVFTSYRQRIAEGQVCALCFSDRVERRCGVCGRAYCSFCSQCFFMREGCLRCKTPLVHGTTPAKVVKTAEATLLSRLRRFLRL